MLAPGACTPQNLAGLILYAALSPAETGERIERQWHGLAQVIGVLLGMIAAADDLSEEA
jgi:hypothetical protein